MKDKIEVLADDLGSARTIIRWEELRQNFLGKNGEITKRLANLKNLESGVKVQAAKEINEFKNRVLDLFQSYKDLITAREIEDRIAQEKVDVTLPVSSNFGSIHLLGKTIKDLSKIIHSMGFELAEGPEVENDFYNFGALRIGPNHPARGSHDTFYLRNSEFLLRTHTSSVQIRTMEQKKPPLRIACLGRVYRADYDATHVPMFHQIEALLVDKVVSLGNLRWVLEEMLSKFFMRQIVLRMRPSYFPFTEPSAEFDIGYSIKDNRIELGGNDKWLELGGLGLVHPEILTNFYPGQDVQGMAFGFGIDRLCMLKYGLKDLRALFDSNLNWLEHYRVTA